MATESTSWSLIAAFGYAIACSMLACSPKFADLGNNDNSQNTGGQTSNGPIYSTGIASGLQDAGAATGGGIRLVDKEQRENGLCSNGYPSLSQFGVDSGRLTWLSLSSVNESNEYFLRSCDVDNCAGTVTVSAPRPSSHITCNSALGGWLQMVGRQCFWGEPAYSSYDIATTSTVSGSTVSLVSLPVSSFGIPIVDGSSIYGLDSQNALVKCDWFNCANTTKRFTMTPSSGVEPLRAAGIVAQDEDYFYLVDMITSSGGMRLLRVIKDASSPFEVVMPFIQTKPGAYSVHHNTLYWVEDVVAGQLLSCPSSGCIGAPTVLMSGLNSPTGLLVDDTSLYALEPPTIATSGQGVSVTLPGRILKCPLSGCANPTVLYTTTDESSLDQMTVDARFVYFRGSYCDPNLATFETRCGFIAAIPK